MNGALPLLGRGRFWEAIFVQRKVVSKMIKTTGNVIELENMVANARGNRLREILDAARDVARQSDRAELRQIAQIIVNASRRSHPEYWDPTLRGA